MKYSELFATSKNCPHCNNDENLCLPEDSDSLETCCPDCTICYCSFWKSPQEQDMNIRKFLINKAEGNKI